MLLRHLSALVVLFNLIVGITIGAAYSQGIRQQRVSIPPGQTGKVISKTIRGAEIIDYRFGASARQRLDVSFNADNPSAFFNVTAPRASSAIHIGSVDGNRFTTVLPASGDYTIRVYLMRNAARRNERAHFELSIRINSHGQGENPKPDYADGKTGGPDFWEVYGVASDDSLNVRSRPSSRSSIIARVNNGYEMRNLGCQMNGRTRWCHIESRNGQLRGWVAGRYLRKGSN